MVYKLKWNNDKKLRIKPRIDSHSNKSSKHADFLSECCMCPPVEIWIVLSVSTIEGWHNIHIDFEKDFSPTSPAEREVFVIPLRDSDLKNEIWLVLVAA